VAVAAAVAAQWKLLPQLLIVSADRAVKADFLHFAKGLKLSKQLAHNLL